MGEGDTNGFNQIGIKTDTYYPGLEVKKNGDCVWYTRKTKKIKILTDQRPSIATTSLLMMAWMFSIKYNCDDYDGVGPSGKGSPNDIPNPKRIKRHTKTSCNSDCEESSEYKDCDEELSE